MIKFSASLFITMLLALNAIAQSSSNTVDTTLIELKAKLLSSVDSSVIPYANIILHRTNRGTTTNNEGYFSLEILIVDSLEVTSVGYKKVTLKIPIDYTGCETLSFYMEPIFYNVGEVTVEGRKTKELDYFEHGQPTNIPTQLRGDAFNQKPTVFQSLKSPASFLQYTFSKKEKERRAVREAIATDERWKALSLVYNKETVMQLTGLNEAYTDTFMLWINSKNLLQYTANEYQVKTSISKYFPKFKQDHNLQ